MLSLQELTPLSIRSSSNTRVKNNGLLWFRFSLAQVKRFEFILSLRVGTVVTDEELIALLWQSNTKWSFTSQVTVSSSWNGHYISKVVVANFSGLCSHNWPNDIPLEVNWVWIWNVLLDRFLSIVWNCHIYIIVCCILFQLLPHHTHFLWGKINTKVSH